MSSSEYFVMFCPGAGFAVDGSAPTLYCQMTPSSSSHTTHATTAAPLQSQAHHQLPVTTTAPPAPAAIRTKLCPSVSTKWTGLPTRAAGSGADSWCDPSEALPHDCVRGVGVVDDGVEVRDHGQSVRRTRVRGTPQELAAGEAKRG